MSSLDELLSGEFRFIPAMECHTMLKLQKDATSIVYHIPASSVNGACRRIYGVTKKKITVNHLFLLSVGKMCSVRKGFSTRISCGIVLESFCPLLSQESTRCSLNMHCQKDFDDWQSPR